MKLTNSCLTEKEVSLILKTNWNIDVQNTEVIHNSTSFCRKIITKNNCYILKEFQDSHPISHIELEYSVCYVLLKNAVPVSQIIPTIEAMPYVIYKNRSFQLQRYINGVTRANHSLSNDELFAAATELAKIHNVLKTQQLPNLFNQNWFNKFNETVYQDFYYETLSLLESANIEQSRKDKITEDICFRIKLSAEMKNLEKSFRGVTYSASHGDYIPSQILYSGNTVVGIIDWANAHTVPVIWELIRFFCLSTKDICDLDLLSKYISVYIRYNELSEIDLINMPLIYAYYMGRNRFLYRTYINTTQDIDFFESYKKAFACRFYFENADSISTVIKKAVFHKSL